jgi:hypothetical protein
MGNISSNLVERNVVEAFGSAGLAIERKEVIGTEFKQYTEERTQPAQRSPHSRKRPGCLQAEES